MRGISAILVCFLWTSLAQAQNLPSEDQSSKDPSFQSFRSGLIQSLKKRDLRSVESMISPKIEFSFGVEPGYEKDPIGAFLAFHQLDREPAKSPFWGKLLEVLQLGCIQKSAERFECPYVSAKWPESLDAQEGLAVIAKQAEIKAAPRSSAQTIRRVGQVTLKVPPPGLRDGWYPVGT